jgi:hypothetical protein
MTGVLLGKERVNGDICLPFYCGACVVYFMNQIHIFMLQWFLSSKAISFQNTEKEENYKLYFYQPAVVIS